MDIEEIHKIACLNKKDTYIDPNSGLHVKTQYSLIKRGTCCGMKCRHCPYNWKNVRLCPSDTNTPS
jgi:hypothetical protein